MKLSSPLSCFLPRIFQTLISRPFFLRGSSGERSCPCSRPARQLQGPCPSRQSSGRVGGALLGLPRSAPSVLLQLQRWSKPAPSPHAGQHLPKEVTATSIAQRIPPSRAAPTHPRPRGHLPLAALWLWAEWLRSPSWTPPFTPCSLSGTWFDSGWVAGVNADNSLLLRRVPLRFCLPCSGPARTLPAHGQQGFPSPRLSAAPPGTALPAACWAQSSGLLSVCALYTFSSLELQRFWPSKPAAHPSQEGGAETPRVRFVLVTGEGGTGNFRWSQGDTHLWRSSPHPGCTGERGFASLIFLPSAFLVSVSSDRRYEEALSDYQMALAHLRENPFIDYKQLGLRHVLYAWEVRGRQRGSAARSSAGGIFRSPAEGARNPRAFQDSTGQQQNNSARAVRAFFKRNFIIKVTEQRHL